MNFRILKSWGWNFSSLKKGKKLKKHKYKPERNYLKERVKFRNLL